MLTANQDRSCNHVGQYVIIYNERNQSVEYTDALYEFALLELCKVKIYGKCKYLSVVQIWKVSYIYLAIGN